MSATATIQSIYRYPVKGLSPESLDGVRIGSVWLGSGERQPLGETRSRVQFGG